MSAAALVIALIALIVAITARAGTGAGRRITRLENVLKLARLSDDVAARNGRQQDEEEGDRG